MLDPVKQFYFVRHIVTYLRRFFGDDQDIAPVLRLIRENRIALLKPCLEMNQDETSREVLRHTVSDFFEHYQTIRVRKVGESAPLPPKGSFLIHQPLAMIGIPPNHESYWNAVGVKTRNMIRKAEKNGYEFQPFNWNDHLDRIHAINTSKEIRSSGKMHGWYTLPVQPRNHTKEDERYRKYYGVFRKNELCAYLHMVECGNFAYFRHFIGHGDHLKHGIMNFLISHAVSKYSGHPTLKWLNYGWMLPDLPSTRTVSTFKKHAGFSGFAGFLEIGNDRELNRYHKGMRDINCEILWP